MLITEEPAASPGTGVTECENFARVSRLLPDHPERSVADGPVGLDVQLLLEVLLLVLLVLVVLLLLLLLLVVVVVVVVVVCFNGCGLNLRRGRGRCRPGGLARRRRGEVGLLLAGVEHHGRCGRRGGVLLDRVHGGGGARVLQVVVVVVHVGGRQVLQLVVVMRVMGSHCRGASVIRGHHFGDICRRCAAQSHPERKTSPARSGSG